MSKHTTGCPNCLAWLEVYTGDSQIQALCCPSCDHEWVIELCGKCMGGGIDSGRICTECFGTGRADLPAPPGTEIDRIMLVIDKWVGTQGYLSGSTRFIVRQEIEKILAGR